MGNGRRWVRPLRQPRDQLQRGAVKGPSVSSSLRLNTLVRACARAVCCVYVLYLYKNLPVLPSVPRPVTLTLSHSVRVSLTSPHSTCHGTSRMRGHHQDVTPSSGWGAQHAFGPVQDGCAMLGTSMTSLSVDIQRELRRRARCHVDGL